MSYSDLYLKQHAVPPKILIGVSLLASVLLFVFLFAFKAPPAPSRALALSKHEVVSLSPNEAGILLQTKEKESGFLQYGLSGKDLSLAAFDVRDLEGKQEKHTLHYFVLKNLNPDTIYSYQIVSGNRPVTVNGRSVFELKTPPKTNTSSVLIPAYGKITYANGAPAANVLVILTFPRAYSLIALTKVTGEWLIPLQYIIDKQTLSPLHPSEKEKISLDMMDDEGNASHIETLVTKTHPLPQTITIGKNYSFLETEEVLSSQTSAGAVEKGEVNILFPLENAIIPGNLPLIKGTGMAGKEMKVSVSTDPPTRLTVIPNANGEWAVNLPKPLPPGAYSLTIVTMDQQNKAVTLNRSFTIAKSGEQVLGDATPEATLTPTQEPVISPTPTPPAGGVDSPTPTPPETGWNQTPLALFSGVLLLVGIGVFLVF